MAKIRVARLCCLLAMAIPSIGLAQRGHLPGEIPLDLYPAFAVSELDDVDRFVENLWKWQKSRLETFSEAGRAGHLPEGISRNDENESLAIRCEVIPEFTQVGPLLGTLSRFINHQNGEIFKLKLLERGFPADEINRLRIEDPDFEADKFYGYYTFSGSECMFRVLETGSPKASELSACKRLIRLGEEESRQAFATWYLGRVSAKGRRVLFSYFAEEMIEGTTHYWFFGIKLSEDEKKALEYIEKIPIDDIRSEFLRKVRNRDRFMEKMKRTP